MLCLLGPLEGRHWNGHQHEKVYWGLTPVKGKGRKWDWAEVSYDGVLPSKEALQSKEFSLEMVRSLNWHTVQPLAEVTLRRASPVLKAEAGPEGVNGWGIELTPLLTSGKQKGGLRGASLGPHFL